MKRRRNVPTAVLRRTTRYWPIWTAPRRRLADDHLPGRRRNLRHSHGPAPAFRDVRGGQRRRSGSEGPRDHAGVRDEPGGRVRGADPGGRPGMGRGHRREQGRGRAMTAPLLTPREWSEMWQALRDFLTAEIARLEPMSSMEDGESDEMAAGVAAGGQEAHEATLAKMTELEAQR